MVWEGEGMGVAPEGTKVGVGLWVGLDVGVFVKVAVGVLVLV